MSTTPAATAAPLSAESSGSGPDRSLVMGLAAGLLFIAALFVMGYAAMKAQARAEAATGIAAAPAGSGEL